MYRSTTLRSTEKIGIGTGLDNLAVDVDGKYGLKWELAEFTAMGLVTKQPDLKSAVDNVLRQRRGQAITSHPGNVEGQATDRDDCGCPSRGSG